MWGDIHYYVGKSGKRYDFDRYAPKSHHSKLKETLPESDEPFQLVMEKKPKPAWAKPEKVDYWMKKKLVLENGFWRLK